MHLAIISSGRPGNVARMATWTCHEPATWYVGDDEGEAYRAAGAALVVEAGGLCASRNAALDAAGDQLCVQLSDDLRHLGWAVGPRHADVRPLTLAKAVDLLAAALRQTPRARLASPAPTDNPFYARRGVQRAAYCLGDLMAVRPTPLRFDTALALKEDYDFTLAHLARYGQVARVGQLLASFEHRTNPGGAVAVRTAALEQASIAYLQAKWPGCLRPNPRRPNEVLLRWPGRARATAPLG